MDPADAGRLGYRDAESHGITKRNGVVLTPNQWVPIVPGDTIEIGEVALAYSLRPSAVLNALLAPASVTYGPRDGAHHPSAPPGPLAAAAYGAPGTNRGRERISVRQGPGQGAVAELSDVTIIGNHPQQATLVLPDPLLGPRHVEILRQPDGFYARDLGTPIGTSCRGQRLGPQPYKLTSGDVLMLGHSVALLFEATP